MMEGLDFKGIVHYKAYARFERIELEPILEETPLRRLIRSRRSLRIPSRMRLDAKTIHEIIARGAGRTGITEEEVDFRAYPSAGARYPLELYLVVFDIEGLERGIYHFQPMDGSLEVLWPGDYLERIDELLDDALEGFRENAKAFIVLTSIEDRTTYKYGDEGKIFPYIEAGHLSQNLILLFQEIGINTVMVGMPWCAEGMGELLDVNTMREKVVSGLVVL